MSPRRAILFKQNYVTSFLNPALCLCSIQRRIRALLCPSFEYERLRAILKIAGTRRGFRDLIAISFICVREESLDYFSKTYRRKESSLT